MTTPSRKLAFTLAILSIAGCAALIPTPARSPLLPAHSQTSTPAGLQGLHDIRGAIELHSEYSHDGTTSVETIARLAQAADLDFIIITDHGNLRARRHEQATGRPLVLAGSEISTTAGHLLALGITREVPNNQPADQIVEQIHAQRGLVIVSDPTSPKKPWNRWDLPVDGLAVIDLNDLLFEDPLPWLFMKALLLPNPIFWHTSDRRPSDVVTLWDQQLRPDRRLIGIGSHDTHAHVGIKPFVIDSFSSGFRRMTTHVLVAEATPPALYDGLRQGRVYVAFDGMADSRPFLFAAQHAGGWTLMGDTLSWSEGLTAVVQLSRSATITLFRNGVPVSRIEGGQARWPIAQPGVYRVEVSLRGRPWIFSNPIYVVESAR